MPLIRTLLLKPRDLQPEDVIICKYKYNVILVFSALILYITKK